MNPFAALAIEPKLDATPEDIEHAWREISKYQHPDAGGDERAFAAAREARTALAAASSRLAAWLELHGHLVNPRGDIAAEIMDLFTPVGSVIQRTTAIARRRATATTALGLAMLENDTLLARADLEKRIASIDAAIARQCAHFPAWQASPASIDPAGAATTVRNLRFLEKWKRDLMAAYASLA